MPLARSSFNKIRRFGLRKKKFIYSKKTYSNPFFRHKRVISKSSAFSTNKFKLIIFALIIVVLICVWLLFFSALFKITKIEISGMGDSEVKKIESLAKSLTENRLLGKNNLLLYNKNELIRVLNDNYYLENLSIKKRLFHTLKIALQEKQQIAVWYEDEKYFYLDSEGKVINQIDPLNINRLNYPIIENLTDIKIENRQANINRQIIEYALSLFNEFKDNQHGFELEKLILDKDVNTIKMAILGGPKIYFNTEETVAKQTARLDLIIKEKPDDGFKNKTYIDLRFGDNIYIK